MMRARRLLPSASSQFRHGYVCLTCTNEPHTGRRFTSSHACAARQHLTLLNVNVRERLRLLQGLVRFLNLLLADVSRVVAQAEDMLQSGNVTEVAEGDSIGFVQKRFEHTLHL